MTKLQLYFKHPWVDSQRRSTILGAIQVLRNARGWGGGGPALRSVTGGWGVSVLVLRNACIYFTR